MGGWNQLVGADDGKPMIVCFSTCLDSIRTIAATYHDQARPEDHKPRRSHGGRVALRLHATSGSFSLLTQGRGDQASAGVLSLFENRS